MPFCRLGATAVLAASLAALGSCRFPTAVELPTGAEPMSAPEVYARWWRMTEACSGVSGTLADVSFYRVPHVDSFTRDGKSVLGYWTSAGNQIVLAEGASLDGGNVRHEMLHALLRVGGHPRDQFLEKCLGTVDCGPDCIGDAGAAPAADPAAVPLAPSGFEVTVQVAPSAPTSAVDGGFFTLTVSVHNPIAHDVIAKLGATNARAVSFLYDVRGGAGGVIGSEIVLDPSAVTFGPGETKRQVFDFSIGNDISAGRLPPGTYTVVGGYGSNRAPALSIDVGP